MYVFLLFALPATCIVSYVWLRRRMARERVPTPPTGGLATVLATYGTLLFFGVSELLGAWSAMHMLAGAALIAVGAPWLLVQGILQVRAGTPTGYHRAVAALSLAFPFLLAGITAAAWATKP